MMEKIQRIIDIIVELNILVVQVYIASALVLAFFAIIVNSKKLKRLNMKQQMLFFILQPILWLKEIVK